MFVMEAWMLPFAAIRSKVKKAILYNVRKPQF